MTVESTVIPGTDSALNAGHAEVFHFKVFIEAVLGTFTADPGFLHPAERCNFGRHDTGVDADHSIFQGFRNPPDSADIPAEKIRREPEFSVIGHPDRFFFGAETEYLSLIHI